MNRDETPFGTVQCERCGRYFAGYRVTTDVLDELVCLSCAEEAKKLHIQVEELKKVYDTPETVAEKAKRAREIMDKALKIFSGGKP